MVAQGKQTLGTNPLSSYHCSGVSRYVLQRDEKTVRTPYGDVRMKVASGMGTERAKPEFDDIAKLATENNVPLRTIRDAIAADRTGKNE